MILIEYLSISLAVCLVVFSLMWCSKLQGGSWAWLEDRAFAFHEFCKNTFAGICATAAFILLNPELSLVWWEWLASVAVGALACWIGEKFGTGWQSGAVVLWDADHYWQEMEQESFMEWPVFKQIIRLLPKNMFGVFMVIALRGVLWGFPFVLLFPISFEFHKLIFAWVVALPAAHAMGAGFQYSLTPDHGAWGRKEELRWLITLLIAVNL